MSSPRRRPASEVRRRPAPPRPARAHAQPDGAWVDATLATIRDLGRAQPGLLVHGGYHARNIPAAARAPWLAIHPKGVAGDPAYGAGTLVKARAGQIHDCGDLRRAVHRFGGRRRVPPCSTEDPTSAMLVCLLRGASSGAIVLSADRCCVISFLVG
ncbi:aminoglycoside phosphotransferase family protein [Kitasatospora hibisci]|uniref:aminoglycoside phosphotransferase family protein n=1 Tax=Kitasatospora hibisci TaxID=3369522 RepID=UPI0037547F41